MSSSLLCMTAHHRRVKLKRSCAQLCTHRERELLGLPGAEVDDADARRVRQQVDPSNSHQPVTNHVAHVRIPENKYIHTLPSTTVLVWNNSADTYPHRCCSGITVMAD